jgi:chromosomal replication initiator protein
MNSIWKNVKSEIAQRIPDHSFKMWIEPLGIESSKGNKVQLMCPNQFFKKRIHDHFGEIIQSVFQQLMGKTVPIEYIVVQTESKKEQGKGKPEQLPLPTIAVQTHAGRLLRQDYTFDQFVVGKNNDFAYSAALSLAVRQNAQQHSLFLLSKSGMGKSHLSQAIGHQILSEFPGQHVYYMTAEDFTNEMVASFKSNTVNQFKDKYHKMCDVLLLDDIQYLSGKERTQIELAYTLDSLFNDNKKIIFSSCYAPSQIPKLNENLRSRLNYGLISSIDPPDYQTRLKILKTYAKGNGWRIPSEVAEYLASELSQDVRQLKSGLAGVATKASLLGCPLDVELAASVIQNMVNKSKDITINLIKKMVCNYYKVSLKELVSRSRKQSIVRPRQVGIYLARRYTDQPLQVIGKSFNRYHATALHAIGAVEKGIKQGNVIQKHVQYLCKKIEAGDF